MDDVIKLVAQTYTQDEYGVQKATESEKQVFCKIESVTRAEFFDGGRNGLNPEMRFDVFAADYSGETVVVWRENRYAVYRVYNGGDYAELYTERKGGTNGSSS